MNGSLFITRKLVLVGFTGVLCLLLLGCNNAAQNPIIDALSSAGETVASALVKAYFQALGAAVPDSTSTSMLLLDPGLAPGLLA